MAFDLHALQDLVKSSSRITPRGHGTKASASAHASAANTLDLAHLSGIIDYQPSEFIVTVWAGTPIRDVQTLLAERGQYLPFDPLLAERGATVGGTIAANASGPERFRYGGVRDFIIGCRFINGNGELLQGGGKVVKNAAGFDYPKLFVGSMGTLGALVDVTFKVFPAPEAYATLRIKCDSLDEALALLPKLTNSPYDINAIDLLTHDKHVERSVENQPMLQSTRAESKRAGTPVLLIRVGGLVAGLPQRMDRVRALCGKGDVLTGNSEQALWREAREFTWAEPNEQIIKVPVTPAKIATLDARLGDMECRYSVGGNVAWVAAPNGHALDGMLRDLGLSGLVLLNADGEQRIGLRERNIFIERAKRALDPLGKFVNG